MGKKIFEIVSEHGVHPNQITYWKKQFFEALTEFLI